ncbi:cytokine-inducible SH2-containing protein-like [Convolutriloba macropyga]|uniref:cytokine-inducible SH2-containing protein-like n=1 Tax=Convolutriloba macropyga TaxID=536237 RepID=UPI003F524253
MMPTIDPFLDPVNRNNRDSKEHQPPSIPPRLPLSKVRSSNLFASMSELVQKNVPWYWGPLKRRETIALLEGRPNGCFLVRDSSSLNHVFSLTVRRTKCRVVDIRIEYLNNEFRLQANDFTNLYRYGSLIELIEQTLECIERGDTCFTSPQMIPGVAPKAMKLQSFVSRHEVVPTLAYLSRMRLHQIKGCLAPFDTLPLPPTLSDYLKSCPFYDPKLVNSVVDSFQQQQRQILLSSSEHSDSIVESPQLSSEVNG